MGLGVQIHCPRRLGRWGVHQPHTRYCKLSASLAVERPLQIAVLGLGAIYLAIKLFNNYDLNHQQLNIRSLLLLPETR